MIVQVRVHKYFVIVQARSSGYWKTCDCEQEVSLLDHPLRAKKEAASQNPFQSARIGAAGCRFLG